MNILYLASANLIVLALLMLLAGKLRKEIRQRDLVIDTLRKDFAALCTGATRVGSHLSRIDQDLRRLYERQDLNESRDPSDRAYNQAIRLIRSGATVEKLIASCGLARAEAELLMMLHRNNEPQAKPVAQVGGRQVRMAAAR